MHNPTNLESLLNELNEFKKEMFLFIGSVHEYKRKNIDNSEAYREKRVKWVADKLHEINKNLAPQEIDLDVLGLVEYDSYGYSIVYKPSFILKTESLYISYKTGFFSDKFKVYSLEKDLVQIQPKLKVKKALSDIEFQAISQLLQTGIAEVAQHRFEEFKPHIVSNKNLNKKQTIQSKHNLEQPNEYNEVILPKTDKSRVINRG